MTKIDSLYQIQIENGDNQFVTTDSFHQEVELYKYILSLENEGYIVGKVSRLDANLEATVIDYENDVIFQNTQKLGNAKYIFEKYGFKVMPAPDGKQIFIDLPLANNGHLWIAFYDAYSNEVERSLPGRDKMLKADDYIIGKDEMDALINELEEAGIVVQDDALFSPEVYDALPQTKGHFAVHDVTCDGAKGKQRTLGGGYTEFYCPNAVCEFLKGNKLITDRELVDLINFLANGFELDLDLEKVYVENLSAMSTC